MLGSSLSRRSSREIFLEDQRALKGILPVVLPWNGFSPFCRTAEALHEPSAASLLSSGKRSGKSRDTSRSQLSTGMANPIFGRAHIGQRVHVPDQLNAAAICPQAFVFWTWTAVAKRVPPLADRAGQLALSGQLQNRALSLPICLFWISSQLTFRPRRRLGKASG